MVSPAQWVLATAFVVLLFNAGSRFAMSLMLQPMSLDLGWSRTTLSTTVTIFMVVSALSLPLAGRLVDRWGARPVLALGIAISGIGLAAMGWITSPIQAYLLYGVVFAFGSATTSITPIGVMLSRWYPHRVGMANSIAISGMGVGQLLIVSALASQLLLLGWRGAYVGLGVVVIAVALPLVLIAGRGRAPASTECAVASGLAAEANGDGPTPASPAGLGTIVRRPGFWAVAVMYILCGFQDFLIATHVVAYALDEGVSPLLAGNMLAFMGLAGLVGVLLTGALADRYGPGLPTAICFAVRALAFAVLVYFPSAPVIIVVALVYGFTFWITAPLTVVFARILAGVSMLGTLIGVITMLHHVAGGLGALVGANAFDYSGSYEGAMVLMLVLSLVALLTVPMLFGLAPHRTPQAH